MIDHDMTSESTSAINKTIVIDNNQVYFYSKMMINDDIEVLIPPVTKNMMRQYNMDEVLFIPNNINRLTGLRFKFINTLNLRTISNSTPRGGEMRVSNLITRIEEFSYIKISNSIIIKESFRDLSPIPDETLFKGSNNTISQNIEDHIDSILEYICNEYKKTN